ncbi:MAG: N-6 DNA methylase [Acidimicrobiales bacterium]|jgi:adenine-specific DNA-methyltransferase
MIGPDTPELRKARGAFFTPPAVAAFMANWAVRSEHDRLLEPSCGEASFLLAAHARLRALGAESTASDQLVGVELHQASGAHARDVLDAAGAAHTITVGDYWLFRYERGWVS